MYDKDLSKIFDRQGYDKKKYPWNFQKSSYNIKPSKIFYSIGDSWLFSQYFVRTFANKYQDYLFDAGWKPLANLGRTLAVKIHIGSQVAASSLANILSSWDLSLV